MTKKLSSTQFLTIFSLLVLLPYSLTTEALSANTANTIHGTKPYLLLDGVPITSTGDLLGFSYSASDGSEVKVNFSQSGDTIIVPTGTKENTLKALIAIDGSSKPLLASSIIGHGLEPIDDDGDSGLTISGNLTATFTKDNNSIVPSSAALDPCYNYKLSLSLTTPVKVLTSYGDPIDNTYSGATSSTFDIEVPPPSPPYTCFAQPTLNFGSGDYAGPASQWNSAEGFIPQSSTALNFPTTGSHGLYFYLRFAGTTAQDVIDTTTGGTGIYQPAGSQISLLLSNAVPAGKPADPRSLKVELRGPKDGSVTAVFSPTTFVLKATNNSNIYSFKINKWFVVSPTNKLYTPGGFASGVQYITKNYCANLTGITSTAYRVPSYTEYADGAAEDWLAGYRHFTRTINGKLFSEWGETLNSNYENSDWRAQFYWAIEQRDGLYQYIVLTNSTYHGLIGYAGPTDPRASAACVSP